MRTAPARPDSAFCPAGCCPRDVHVPSSPDHRRPRGSPRPVRVRWWPIAGSGASRVGHDGGPPIEHGHRRIAAGGGALGDNARPRRGRPRRRCADSDAHGSDSDAHSAACNRYRHPTTRHRHAAPGDAAAGHRATTSDPDRDAGPRGPNIRERYGNGEQPMVAAGREPRTRRHRAMVLGRLCPAARGDRGLRGRVERHREDRQLFLDVPGGGGHISLPLRRPSEHGRGCDGRLNRRNRTRSASPPSVTPGAALLDMAVGSRNDRCAVYPQGRRAWPGHPGFLNPPGPGRAGTERANTLARCCLGPPSGGPSSCRVGRKGRCSCAP